MNPGLIQNIERKKTRNLSNESYPSSKERLNNLCIVDETLQQSTIYKPKFQGRSYKKKNIIYNEESELSNSLKEQPSSSTSSLSKSSKCALDFQEKNVGPEQRFHIQASEMPRIFFCSKIYKIEYALVFG